MRLFGIILQEDIFQYFLSLRLFSLMVYPLLSCSSVLLMWTLETFFFTSLEVLSEVELDTYKYIACFIMPCNIVLTRVSTFNVSTKHSIAQDFHTFLFLYNVIL